MAIGQFIAIIAMVGIFARWLGVGDQMTTATYGAFRMPIDALWNPGVTVYRTMLPGSNNDTIWFEGFQYLGVGGLLLIALAIGVAMTRPASPQSVRIRRVCAILPPPC